MIKDKVVFVGLLPPVVNGQSVATDRILKFLREKEVDIAVLPLPDVHRPAGMGAKLAKIISFASLMFRFFLVTGTRRKIVYLSGARSVVGFYRNLPLILWSALFRHKSILHFHCGDYTQFLNGKSTFFQWVNRKAFYMLDTIIILGESLRPAFSIDTSIASKLAPIPYGVPIDKVQRPKSLPVHPNEFVRLLFLSNLIESKGFVDVLKAVQILVKEYKHQHIICDFCGAFMSNSDDIEFSSANDAKAFFEAFVEQHSVQENIRYNGTVTGAVKAAFLQHAHFFLLPTNYNTEGQPVSILEAMSYGTVPIATSYRAIPDMIIDGETGFLVNYASPRMIAATIDALILEPATFSRVSGNAIQHVRENFSVELHLQKVFSVFETLSNK